MTGRLVNFNDFLESHPFTRLQVLVVTFCAAVAMLDGFDTQSIAYVAPAIAVEWGLKPGVFGSVFGAGLFGLMLGALVFGPAADRFGRKRLLIISVIIFGLGSLLTPLVHTLDGLLVIRMFTGFGLGGAMPNLIALTSEYSPSRLRATVVTIMFCGVPLGATLGGLLSAWMIPAFGWPSVFYLGGILPLCLALALAICMPESVRFMIAAGAPQAKIKAVVSRIAPRQDYLNDTLVLPEERAAGVSVVQLFGGGRMTATLLVWLTFFMNLLVMYFLINWLPTLVRNAGPSPNVAIFSTVLLNLGGAIGGVALGRLIDRFGPFKLLSSAYAAAALAILMMATAGAHATILLIFVFIAGAGIIGAQIGMNALTAELYPTTIRSSGVGWALGIGRIGSIIGPLIGGVLISRDIDAGSIICLSAIPAVVAAAAVAFLGRISSAHQVLRSPICVD